MHRKRNQSSIEFWCSDLEKVLFLPPVPKVGEWSQSNALVSNKMDTEDAENAPKKKSVIHRILVFRSGKSSISASSTKGRRMESKQRIGVQQNGYRRRRKCTEKEISHP